MALHPFRTFQKNQKAWLAGIGVATMISFILLPVLMQLFTRGGSQVGQVLAKSRSFGSVTNQSVALLNNDRDTLRSFVTVLLQKLAADPADETRMNTLRPLMQYVRQYERRLNTETLINNWLMSQYAKKQGLRADWQVIKDNLNYLTGNSLTEAVFQDTLRSTGISQQRLEYLFGEEIVRQQLISRFEMSIEPVSPASRWDWYQRLYRTVQIEAAAVSVEPFIAQVKEPSDAELRKFFEENKDNYNDPASATPGFIEPVQLAFQYVYAAPGKKILDSVSEDEIKKFYEENKDSLFRRQTAPLQSFPDLPGLNNNVPFPAPPKPEAPAVPETKDSDKKDVKPETQETESKEEPKKTSMTEPASVAAKFVKYQAETKEEEPQNAAPEKSNDNEPVDLSILYRPYDDVKEDIRKQLAREKAAALLPAIQEKMRAYARSYNEAFESGKTIPPLSADIAQTAAESGLELKTVPLGTLFTNLKDDFARQPRERQRLFELYVQKPLVFESEIFFGTEGSVLLWVTQLIDEKKPVKFEDTGKETVLKRWKEVQARSFAREQAEKLAAEAGQSQKSLAETFKDNANVKVADTEPFSWKTYGAGIHPLTALMQGQRPFNDQIREQGVASGNALIDNKVIFFPGDTFMEKVFSLSVGETGTAFNAPENSAYVIRIKSSSPSEEVLWERFQTAYLLEYIYAGQPEVTEAASDDWQNRIYEETGFQWVAKPKDLER